MNFTVEHITLHRVRQILDFILLNRNQELVDVVWDGDNIYNLRYIDRGENPIPYE